MGAMAKPCPPPVPAVAACALLLVLGAAGTRHAQVAPLAPPQLEMAYDTEAFLVEPSVRGQGL